VKKSYKFNELSDVVCQGKGCDRKLKKRRVEGHGDTLCFKCHIRAGLRSRKWNNHISKLRKAGLVGGEI
jgi:hypothetical protein